MILSLDQLSIPGLGPPRPGLVSVTRGHTHGLDLAVWEATAQPEIGTPCHTVLQGWDLFPRGGNCKSLMNTLGYVAQCVAQ